MKNIFHKLAALCPDHENLVLATVAETHGSTPQKPGYSVLFEAGSLLEGTIGGGVVEGRTAGISTTLAVSKISRWYRYMLNNEISSKEEAICGGEILILIDGNPYKHIDVFNDMMNSRAKREPGILITVINGEVSADLLIDRYWYTGSKNRAAYKGLGRQIIREASALMNRVPDFKIMRYEDDKGSSLTVIFEPILPGKKLIIAGAGHIGRALSHLGRLLDFEVTVIDDRSEYANSINLPDADKIIADDIGSVLKAIEKDKDTFIVIVTRGHKDDAEALKQCIGSDAAYIGMIGSKGKTAMMKDEFLTKGWATPEQWQKIFAPIGVDINSRSVEEIAVSIAAQLILIRNS
jgi:xanthine dehydrogenase accessory factor